MSNATLSNVASSASSVTLLNANSSRQKCLIWNNSTAILYVKLGSDAATTTSCTYKMISDAQWEVPAGYTGAITGIWASANGAARITEIA